MFLFKCPTDFFSPVNKFFLEDINFLSLGKNNCFQRDKKIILQKGKKII